MHKNFLIQSYSVYGPVPINGMQPPPPLKSGHIGIKYVQCAETYEKTVFRFYFLYGESSYNIVKNSRIFLTRGCEML